MTRTPDLETLKQQMTRELRENILPFWLDHTIDRENGGFYGALTNDGQIKNDIERSLVLCARVLWTFSNVYHVYGDPAYRAMAAHAYDYLIEKFLDPEFGGMYWWVDRNGKPINDRKQTYGQAYAIYGLAEFYRATGDRAALDHAKTLFGLLEKYAFEPDFGGYIEGCSRNWGPLADMRLSEKEPNNSPKSMNTLLHVLEGYTNLLRAWPDPQVKTALMKLLQVFLTHVVDPETHFTRLFFTNDWVPLTDQISYGHDIETAWLLVEAAEVLGEEIYIERTRLVSPAMAEAVYHAGLAADGSVLAEGTPRGVHDELRHWWCQAEGIVGFVNAYQLTGAEKYAQAALRIWDYIQDKMIDRQYGEWYKIITPDGTPKPGQVKTGPWEDPYHHSRACLEISQRVA